MADLAERLRSNVRLMQAVADARTTLNDADAKTWRETLEPLRGLSGGPGFLDAFDALDDVQEVFASAVIED